MPRGTQKAKDHAEELEELQKRFTHLAEQQKTTESQNNSLMLATRKSDRSTKKMNISLADNMVSEEPKSWEQEAELRRLDEQIVQLRRKHDQLHEKNSKKRTELEALSDKLKDLHNTRFDPKETPESRLFAMEERLAECAQRYDEEHRLHMSYQQVITRLKKEQLEWPAEIKQLEVMVAQKEQDYEQLLVMSHDANSSKEAAKAELSKFESLVLDERKQREKELQERRAVLQKKQQLATELERQERERRQQLQEQQRQQEAESGKESSKKIEEDIGMEQAKIRAYEAAFQQIKEATGVTDVNEVIQRFTLQEETHQNLLAMTRESQAHIEELKGAIEEEKGLVMAAEYSRSTTEGETADGEEDTGRASTLAAQKQLNKARERWRKVLKTSAATKSAVQHIVDVLEPLREKDEVIAPMSDETLLQHVQFIESKLALIGQAFHSIPEELKQQLTSSAGPLPMKGAPLSRKDSASPFGLGKDDHEDDDDDFEEDMEEDVMDRSALKKQSTSILDKGAKKKKPRRRRAKGGDD